MKIKYTFVTGETVEIELDEKWQSVFAELNSREQAVNKKETRRHVTLDVLGTEGKWLEDSQYDPAEIIEDEIRRDERKKIYEKLRKEWAKLTEAQRKLITEIYTENVSVNEYAKREGVDHSAISHRIERIKRKLEKALK